MLATAIAFQVAADTPAPVYRSGVDVVRVAAVVRDERGRFVRGLTASDFEVFDNGHPQPITDFHKDAAGLSVALLFDVSGSMEGHLEQARETALFLLAALYPWVDEAGVFQFDTHLAEIVPFTQGLRQLPVSMAKVVPFGATSLRDAVAQTAKRLEVSDGRRRAVVVFTDGFDNASTLTASQVSGIASSIDVPVYVVGIVSGVDDPTSQTATPAAHKSPLAGDLADLASWTGGAAWVTSAASQRNDVARQIVDELRHQYLMVIKSGTERGWHPLTVNVKRKDLTAHARSGYIVN